MQRFKSKHQEKEQGAVFECDAVHAYVLVDLQDIKRLLIVLSFLCLLLLVFYHD